MALTYVAYTCYHLTRKPISVVKTVLHRNCSLVDSSQQIRSVTDASSEETWCDYAPFGRSILFFITHKQTKQTNENRNGFHSLVQSSNEKYFIKRKMKWLWMRFGIRKPIKNINIITCVLVNLFVWFEYRRSLSLCVYNV